MRRLVSLPQATYTRRRLHSVDVDVHDIDRSAEAAVEFGRPELVGR
jgi:hypothetical protein